VVVTATTAGRFTATFVQEHAPGFTITHTRTGDRIPGKININTIWDPETLRALCDPQPANGFTPADLDAIWNQIVSTTNPNARTTGPGGMPGAADRPFQSLAAPFVFGAADTQYPQGLGVND